VGAVPIVVSHAYSQCMLWVMQRCPRLVVLIVLSGIIALLSGYLAIYQLQAFPILGNDEWWLLSRYDRYVTYGDVADKVAFDLYAGNGEMAKFPPANLCFGAPCM
jgi:hypothetical protein